MTSTVVKTAWRNVQGPLPSLPIVTDRLVIRQFPIIERSDVEKFHGFFARSQTLLQTVCAVACLTDTTKGSLCMGIFLRKSYDTEGDMIGIGGVRKASSQGTWPILNWKIIDPVYKSNYGLLAEFATAFMKFWWSIPEEAAGVKFPLEVPASSVDFPEQDETTVAARVVAQAQIKDAATQLALEEAGFEKYSTAVDADGMYVTCWRNVINRTAQPERPSLPTRPSHLRYPGLQILEEPDRHPSVFSRKRPNPANNGDDRLEFGCAAKRPKLLQQPEQNPSGRDLNAAIWNLLNEDIKKHNLNVFTLPDCRVEGYVPQLSKKFGVALEDAKERIWIMFRSCLAMLRDEKIQALQGTYRQSSDKKPDGAAAREMGRAGHEARSQLRLRPSDLAPAMEREKIDVTLLHRKDRNYSGRQGYLDADLK